MENYDLDYMEGNNRKIIFAIIAVAAIAILASIGYYLTKKGNNGSPNVSPSLSSLIDSDFDAIPDVVEKAIGTNSDKMDSDGDSYGDLSEIKSGYSPLIAGEDGKYTPEELQILKNKIKAANQEFYEKIFGNGSISFACGASMVSDIDGNSYNTVSIGAQCWLKQNLKVTKNPAGEGITRYCYDNDPENCNTDGGLYDWNTAMNESRLTGAQGICPDGWHIPRDSEWYILEKDLSADSCDSIRTEAGCDPVGAKLKNGGVSGFEAIFAGYRHDSGLFYGQGSYAYFWSSLESGDSAWNRNLSVNVSAVYRNPDDKIESFSVRCLKD